MASSAGGVPAEAIELQVMNQSSPAATDLGADAMALQGGNSVMLGPVTLGHVTLIPATLSPVTLNSVTLNPVSTPSQAVQSPLSNTTSSTGSLLQSPAASHGNQIYSASPIPSPPNALGDGQAGRISRCLLSTRLGNAIGVLGLVVTIGSILFSSITSYRDMKWSERTNAIQTCATLYVRPDYPNFPRF